MHRPRWLEKPPRAAKPPEVLPLPSPRSPGYLRAWLSTQVLPGGVHLMCRGPPVAGLGGGIARPPRRVPLASSPSWRGGGAEGGVGGARRGRSSPPLPPLRVRARPRLCQASGARSGPVTSCQAERVGAAGWGLRAGLEEGAGGEVLPGQPDPSPGPPPPLGALLPLPPRVPRFLPAPVAMTTPLPGLCALGPGVVFFSQSLSPFLLFFSPLLSLRVLLSGWRDETEKVLASSGELTSHRGEGDGRREGSDVKRGKKKVFSGASGNKA